MEQVEKLPEFKKLLKQFNKRNGDTSHHFALMVAERPDSTFKYYWFKMGDDGPDLFHTIIHFYVNSNDLSVSYFDTASDSVFTLNQRRKSGKDYLLH